MKTLDDMQKKLDDLKGIIKEQEDVPDDDVGPRSNYERFVAHFGEGGEEDEDRPAIAKEWADKIVDFLGDDSEAFFEFILPPRGTGGEGGEPKPELEPEPEPETEEEKKEEQDKKEEDKTEDKDKK